MAIVGPWAIASYKGKVDWGVVPVPTSTGSQVGQDHTFSDAKNVAMYASCKNRATAWDFMKFSTSEAEDGKLLSLTGQMPLRQNVATTYASYFAKNPSYKTFAAEAARTTEVPERPQLRRDLAELPRCVVQVGHLRWRIRRRLTRVVGQDHRQTHPEEVRQP